MPNHTSNGLLAIVCNGERLPFTIDNGDINWDDGAEQCEDCGADLGEHARAGHNGHSIVCGSCGRSYAATAFSYAS